MPLLDSPELREAVQEQHERFAPLPSGDVVEPKTGLLGGKKTEDREADVNSELTEQSR